MTRRIIGDGQDVFRVVVRRKKQAANPAYERGNGEPFRVLLDEEYSTEYGPYQKIGTARGVQAYEAYKPHYQASSGKHRSELKWGVVDTWIEQVEEIKWKKVPE